MKLSAMIAMTESTAQMLLRTVPQVIVPNPSTSWQRITLTNRSLTLWWRNPPPGISLLLVIIISVKPSFFLITHQSLALTATTKASSPGLEAYDQSKIDAHDYIVHSDLSYHTHTHDLPVHSHTLGSPSKEFDVADFLKSIDEQIKRSANHQSGDFVHHTTTTTNFGNKTSLLEIHTHQSLRGISFLLPCPNLKSSSISCCWKIQKGISCTSWRTCSKFGKRFKPQL